MCFPFFIKAPVQADLTGTQKIRDHINSQLKDIDINSLSIEEKENRLLDPVRLNLNMLIPVYGSTVLDNTLYGNIRPPAYIFDWALGGFIPLGLLLIVGLAGDQLKSGRKNTLV